MERELLAKVALRDEYAFDILYSLYAKKIYGFSLHVLHSDILAEEVMQEVMLKIWLMGDELNDIRNPGVFIRTLARNRSLKVLRRKEVEKRADDKLAIDYREHHNETEEQVILNDTKRILQNGIEMLPAQQKAVYQLCHVEGLKYDEAAERLKLSPLTVATHMKLALKFLREHLRKNSDVAALLIIFKLF
ncbi:MAG TPA: sigma-70 family RNA polymerase sigma factor [Pedobacter sp.]